MTTSTSIMKAPFVVATLASLLAWGCASIHPRASYMKGGNGTESVDTFDRYRELRNWATESSFPEVEVLVDAWPIGSTIDADAGTLTFPATHQILGRFTMAPARGYFFALAVFSDYETEWRKPVCYPQVPLTWITLGLWSVLVPTSYPCWGKAFIEHAQMVRELKALASAAGGNVVIVTLPQTGKRGEIRGASGYIIKKRAEAAVSPQTVRLNELAEMSER